MNQQQIDEWIEKGDSFAQQKNWRQAVYFYAMAANYNDSCALKKLGDCYAQGKGIAVNMEAAFSNYYRSVQTDPFYAAYELGRCYEEGLGTEVNMHKAFGCYQRAMEGCLGDQKAKRKVYEFYKSGIGVKRNLKRARELEAELQRSNKRMDELDEMFRDMGF